MAPHVDYENDNCERENEIVANLTYNAQNGTQCYENQQCTKDVEKRCVTKYKTDNHESPNGHHNHHHHHHHHESPNHHHHHEHHHDDHHHDNHHHHHHDSPSHHHHNNNSNNNCDSPNNNQGSEMRSSAGRTTMTMMRRRSRSATGKSSSTRSGSKRRSTVSSRSRSACGSKLDPVKRSAKCYDVRHGRRPDPCTKKPIWQHGVYVRDMCGEGIVPKRFTFKSSRKIWCKTPLSMYQATIGELGRQLLCRDKIIPRDVKPAPPCNIEEYILPPCRGYYRKYDCLRPCEEEHAVYKGGKKFYRDRVERYWEPCTSKVQKVKLDINEYAPQNAYLAKKMRRYNMQTGGATLPCW